MATICKSTSGGEGESLSSNTDPTNSYHKDYEPHDPARLPAIGKTRKTDDFILSQLAKLKQWREDLKNGTYKKSLLEKFHLSKKQKRKYQKIAKLYSPTAEKWVYGGKEVIEGNDGKQLNRVLWNFREVVDAYQSKTPKKHLNDRDEALKSPEALLTKGFSKTWRQNLNPWPNWPNPEKNNEMAHAVHLTMLAVDVPYEEFLSRMPIRNWGLNFRWLTVRGSQDEIVNSEISGCVKEKGETRLQVQRMSLGGYTGEFSIGATSFGRHFFRDHPGLKEISAQMEVLDMTKTELIIDHSSSEFENPRQAKSLYWRVFHSGNGSTREDVGKVKISSYDNNKTLIYFHSAHRFSLVLPPLGGAGGKSAIIPMTAAATNMMVCKVFLNHAKQYRAVVFDTKLLGKNRLDSEISDV
ncbi:MAG: hypothetical protein GY775_04895 [Candidatus Scalindua sp.]|nr:hypothetical protein [Candidatus Scalindua sp.]